MNATVEQTSFQRPLAARPNSNWTDWGQWIALITMTVDHLVRHLMSPDWLWASSSIGRVAFPLFAGMVAWHGCFNTRNPYRYARRIMVIGIVAQLPYATLPRDGWQWNVCFTLALGLMWFTLYRQTLTAYLQQKDTTNAINVAALTVASVAGFYWLGDYFEYGRLGLLFVPALSLAIVPWHPEWGKNVSAPAAVIMLAVAVVNAAMLNSSVMAKSVTALTTVFFLFMVVGASRFIPQVILPMWRKLWLSWYPGHLAVIALVLLVRAV